MTEKGKEEVCKVESNSTVITTYDNFEMNEGVNNSRISDG